MLLDARAPDKPAGVLIDDATNRRIPFGITADFETGRYTAWSATADGTDIQCDEWMRPRKVEGRAVGKLKLVPLDRAHDLLPRKPQKRRQLIETVSDDVRLTSYQSYKDCYFSVWKWRGVAEKLIYHRWAGYIRDHPDLDCYDLRKRMVRTAT